MLKTLIGKQLLELFHTYVYDRKTGKLRSGKGLVLYLLLVVVLFVSLGAAFFSMGMALGSSIIGSGADWLYPALIALLSIALGVFGSVFNTYASLYLPKDNEFLMSLPIPPRTILLARVVGVYAVSLMYSAWIWIPGMIAYWILVPKNAAVILFPILLTFLLALFVTVLSCLLGWVVALIASKAKGKSFLTVFLSLLVMVLYYVVYFRIVNSLGEIVNHLDSIGSAVRTWLYFVYLIGTAAEGNPLSMLLAAGITVLLAGLCIFIMGKTFSRITAAGTQTARKKEKGERFVLRTPRSALLRRELRHFTSVPTWMLNSGIGLLFMLLLAGGAVFRSDMVHGLLQALSGEMPELAAAVPVLLFALLGMLISCNAVSAASLSMEGSSLWIVRSVPVEPWHILRAKADMHILLNAVPAAVSAVVLAVVCGCSVGSTVLLAAALGMYILLTADFGLFLNLKHPNLEWTNAAFVIKQSLPVFVVMFGGWLFCGVLAFFGISLAGRIGVFWVLAAMTVLIGGLWIPVRLWLKRKGTVLFARL